MLISSTACQPDEASQCIARRMDRFLEFFQKMVAGEKQPGNLRPDVDAGIAACNFCALYFFVLIGFFRVPGLSPQRAIETLGALVRPYMPGILTEESIHVCRP